MIRALLTVFALAASLRAVGVPGAGGAELLANGGFEQGSEAWSVTDGNLEPVAAPVHGGAAAGRFSGSGPTVQFAYQWVSIQPAQSHQLSGWAGMSGGGLSRLFLRVDFFDANGQAVPFRKDSDWLPLPDGTYYFLTTGEFESPSAARQARVSVVVQADSPFTVHIDDIAFAGPEAISSTPSPPPTIGPTPTPPPVVNPTPTPGQPSTPARTPSQPVTPKPGSSPTPVAEPDAFPDLTNASFEELRGDGTPYGWRKQGGDVSSVLSPRTEGTRAVALASETGSTKWVHQTVKVTGGAYYNASIDALAGAGSEAVFLRVSWYASADGSGQAISSADSTESTNEGVGFVRLSTGAAQAPPEAASVKFRLMLRPASDAQAVAYFDSAALTQVQPGEGEVVGAAGAVYAPHGDALGEARQRGAEPGASAAAPTPFTPANVKPAAGDNSPGSAAGEGGGDWWAVVLAITIALAAIALAGGYEWWQRRKKATGGGSDS
ncbi:MAG TPA: hypothetical protein VGR43_04460 [Dehalococcoidia bacterium]|nr:hypothetical protein [Dehalococcoidia bacterium]